MQERPELELVMAGEWSDGREEAERLMATPPLAGRVRLRGVVTGAAKDELLTSVDAFVFPPSQLEGQPLVLLEAMAAGLPIITTRSGLIPETVAEGRNALLVPRGDVAGLAAALRTLRDDPARRASMGRHSRELYGERYTLEHFRRNLSLLVGELLAPPPAVRPGT
jgi:glycosyltransferase involved in cell wall biosynthesis